MKKTILFKVFEQMHGEVKSQASLLGMSIGEYLIYCHQTVGKLAHLAHYAGNQYQDIPEAIDELFECPATEYAITEKLSLFAKQTKEEVK